MTNLINFRTILDNIIGAAVDSSTWTTVMKDEALRNALLEYDDYIPLETSFTVTSTAEAQDLSSITALKEVLSVAYPWTDGADYPTLSRPWRYTADQTIYFEDIEPQSGDTIRVRYTQLHAIEDLDAAAATTVASRHERTLCLSAAIYLIQQRLRQLSENPATPKATIINLLRYIEQMDAEFQERMFNHHSATAITWAEIGL